MTDPRTVSEPQSEARRNVLSRLDAALHWWIEEERFLTEAGRVSEADDAHKNVLRIDRARKAEDRNPGVARSV